MFNEIFDPNKTVRHISMRAMREQAKREQQKMESLAYWCIRGFALFVFILWAVCNG